MPKKCHPCRAKGMERIELFVEPKRKEAIKKYCKANGMTMSRLISTFLVKIENEVKANPLAYQEEEEAIL